LQARRISSPAVTIGGAFFHDCDALAGTRPQAARFKPMADDPDKKPSVPSRGSEVGLAKVPLAEEQLRVGKRELTTGTVQVRTEVDTIEALAQASLDRETVEVTRVPVDRLVDEIPEIRTEDGVTIVPVVEEEAVVVKRLRLKEELHIRRLVETREVAIPVELRRHRASVQRLPADGDAPD
jgi:uncharacterized protein (TIGR02271 family)